MKAFDGNDNLQNTETGSSFVQLFRSPTMRWRTCKLLYIWFVQSLLYYGIVFSTGSLGLNIYLSFVMSGVVEIAGDVSAIFMIESIGRRFTLSGLMVVVGVSCILVLFTHGPAKVVVGMIGKTAISATFAIVFVYTGELSPTPLRGSMVGMGSMISRVGGMICPLVFILAYRWPFVPPTVFAAASIIAAAISVLLPETKGLPLPETLQEAEALSHRGSQRTPLPTKVNEVAVQ